MIKTIQRLAGPLPAADGIATLGKRYADTRETIIAQITKGNLHAKKRIAGIACPDELLTKKMLGYFQREHLEILQIKKKLDTAGLPYRAIVRTDFYERIKRKKGVYTFKNIDEQGAVPVSEKNTTEFLQNEVAAFDKNTEKRILVSQVVLSVIICALIEWCFCAFNWEKPSKDFWPTFWAFHFVILSWSVTCVCAGANAVLDSLLRKYAFTSSSLCERVEKKVSKQALSIFWPNYGDYATGPRVKINFIPPPETIAPKILQWRKAGYAVHISAQKEAFSLDIRPIRILMQATIDACLAALARQRELQLQAAIEARRAFWRRFDPILSVQEGRYTVLIDAYGGKSFVSEAEVTDAVLNEYASKLKQFQTILN